jgi:hypothetical protein
MQVSLQLQSVALLVSLAARLPVVMEGQLVSMQGLQLLVLVELLQ